MSEAAEEQLAHEFPGRLIGEMSILEGSVVETIIIEELKEE